MKELSSDLEKIKEILNSSEEILIAVGSNANFDILAASLAFYISLSNMGKKVTIISPKEPIVEETKLVGINKISASLGGKKLVISVKDALGSVEKVTHYLEGDKLNIVVHPLADSQPLTQDKIELSYGKHQYDLIVLFEIPDFSFLKNLYTQAEDLYSEVKKIAIGKTQPAYNPELAIIEPLPSLSETTSQILLTLKMPIDADTGANLFLGMKSATNGFEIPPATAETFELASFCLKAGGAFKLDLERESIASIDATQAHLDTQITASSDQTEEEFEEVEPEPDWFTPKIYKSSKDPS